MSVYTTEVRFICETYAGLTESVGHSQATQTIRTAAPFIFDFDFPIFDSAYRLTLEEKILRHYYYKEIGVETVGLWKDLLQTRLCEIMPYYNQLYSSTLFDFNPQYEVDYKRAGDWTDHNNRKNTGTQNINIDNTGTQNITIDNTGTQDIDNERTGSQENGYDSTMTRTPNLDHKSKYSDTPQSSTSNLDQDGYLTNYTHELDTGSETNKHTGKDTIKYDSVKDEQTRTDDLHQDTTRTDDLNQDTTRTDDLEEDVNNHRDYGERVFGVQSGVAWMETISKFRDALINIDMLIINDLADLFMNIY